jgi:hypothetical protein
MQPSCRKVCSRLAFCEIQALNQRCLHACPTTAVSLGHILHTTHGKTPCPHGLGVVQR